MAKISKMGVKSRWGARVNNAKIWWLNCTKLINFRKMVKIMTKVIVSLRILG